ncbi:MAG: metal ABC transporter substrate-binding protein [Bacillota bacterium]
MKKSVIIFMAVILLALVAWVGADAWLKKKGTTNVLGQPGKKISVVSSLYPWYDLAREIGGDKVEVKLLLPPGVEAHSFEPTPGDMITTGEADLFVYTGDYLEPWAADILNSLGKEAPASRALGEGLATIKENNPQPGESGLDPHIWLDPSIMSEAAGRMANALGEVDSANRAYYNNRWEDYRSRLDRLDQDFRAGLSRCRTKTFVYSGHYAFGYLAAKYGLDYQAAQGFSPDSESSPVRLAELSRLLSSTGSKYVFSEVTDSPKLAQALSKDTGVQVLQLNSAHSPSRDQIASGLTYESIMRQNLEELRIGLQCR